MGCGEIRAQKQSLNVCMPGLRGSHGGTYDSAARYVEEHLCMRCWQGQACAVVEFRFPGHLLRLWPLLARGSQFSFRWNHVCSSLCGNTLVYVCLCCRLLFNLRLGTCALVYHDSLPCANVWHACMETSACSMTVWRCVCPRLCSHVDLRVSGTCICTVEGF